AALPSALLCHFSPAPKGSSTRFAGEQPLQEAVQLAEAEAQLSGQLLQPVLSPGREDLPIALGAASQQVLPFVLIGDNLRRVGFPGRGTRVSRRVQRYFSIHRAFAALDVVTDQMAAAVAQDSVEAPDKLPFAGERHALTDHLKDRYPHLLGQIGRIEAAAQPMAPREVGAGDALQEVAAVARVEGGLRLLGAVAGPTDQFPQRPRVRCGRGIRGGLHGPSAYDRGPGRAERT